MAEGDESGEQHALFDLEALKVVNQEWVGMPGYRNENQAPWKSILVHFENRADLEAFAALVGQRLTGDTRSIWYPEAEIGRMVTKRFIQEPVPELEPEE